LGLTQLANSVFAVVSRNIAVPVDFAIVGKLAQTVFPDGVPPLPPDAFEGGFDVDSSGIIFADPSYRLVSSELPTSTPISVATTSRFPCEISTSSAGWSTTNFEPFAVLGPFSDSSLSRGLFPETGRVEQTQYLKPFSVVFTKSITWTSSFFFAIPYFALHRFQSRAVGFYCSLLLYSQLLLLKEGAG
jgi:hypothetical protein